MRNRTPTQRGGIPVLSKIPVYVSLLRLAHHMQPGVNQPLPCHHLEEPNFHQPHSQLCYFGGITTYSGRGKTASLLTDDTNAKQQILRGSNTPVKKFRAARSSSHFQFYIQDPEFSYRVNGNFSVKGSIEDYFNNVM